MADRNLTINGSVSQSVLISGDGNTVSLTFGGSSVLRLSRRHVRLPDRRRAQQPGDPPRELDLLDPEHGTLPFVGRVDMLAQLRTWTDSHEDVSVHAVTGRAGSGKTRLALALCEALDPQGPPGRWRAGFLSGANLVAVADALATQEFDWTGSARVLVVLDNAAQYREALARWLDGLVLGRFGTVRLRILLLEREAPEGFGWWHDLAGDPHRRDLFRTPRPIGLPGLADPGERRRLMAAAFEAAARKRAVPVSACTAVPPAGRHAGVDRNLAGPQFGDPLNLVMAGVLALDQGAAAALALRRIDAAQQLGARELRRFGQIAKASGVDEVAMRHAIAFNGLAAELAAAVPGAHPFARLATLLEEELPPRFVDGAVQGERRLGVVKPDLVAEAVTIGAFKGQAWHEACAPGTVERAYALAPHRSAASLMRLVQDFAYAIEDPAASPAERVTAERLMGWLHSLVDGIRDPLDLVPIAQAFPMQSLVLRETAARVQTLVATALGDRARKSGGRDDAAAAAAALNSLATRLSDLGHRDQALAAAQGAVALRRTPVDAGDDTFRPDLAMSLNTLANRLSSLGRWQEALDAVEEAVRLRRALVAARPDAFTPDLAMSLNNLANILGDVGRRDEALAAAREAVSLYRDLVAARPDAFTPELGVSLNNLANRLSDAGHRKEALDTARKAVGLCRTLAATRPGAFTPNLAMALSNLANRLRDAGHRGEALDAAQEAVVLCRGLFGERPEAFRSDLALSLHNLANTLGDLGRRKEALDAAEEAVVFRRALAGALPDAFGPDLARSLGNLAARLGDVGDRAAALAAAQEAVGVYRGLCAARPGVFEPALAASLETLADRLGEADDPAPGLAAAQEAVALRRRFLGARPDAIKPDLARSLGALASRLGNVGDRAAALAAAQEAVVLYRDLAGVQPDAFTTELAIALWAWGERLSENGTIREALDRLGEGVALLVPYAFANPAAFGGRVRGMVESYLSRCREAGVEPAGPLLGALPAPSNTNGVLP